MSLISVKHSFNSGDLITVLPGIKHLYEETGQKAIIYQRLNLPADYGNNDPHPVRSEDGRQVCMNETMFKMLKPLIEAQEYVEKFDIWEGQAVDFDIDLTRQNSQMPLPGGLIHKWPSLIFPQLECSLDSEWLSVANPERKKSTITIDGHYTYEAGCISISDGKWVDNVCNETFPIGQIIINRTERYNNPYISYHFLKDYTNRIVFVGTKEECNRFCKQWDLGCDSWNYIYRLAVDDFYKVAQAIKSCKFFIGNQSLCWHVADAMKAPRILEVCTQYPNTFPTGKGGYSFVTQGALEFFFKKLLNKKNG